MDSNERLRAAITSAGLTIAEVSDRVQVDPKTVERWIASGRVPHAANRFALAGLLGTSEEFLWPTTMLESKAHCASQAELVAVHPSRLSVPAGTWSSVLDGASESIDILAFAASFLADTVPGFIDTIAAKAESGVAVRLLFGDPGSEAMRVRGAEEGIGDSLVGRCVLTWRYLRPLIGRPGVSARMHSATLYTSIFRFDDDLFANTHVYGAPAAQSPVIHLHRIPGGPLFGTYLAGFERTWSDARDVSADEIA